MSTATEAQVPATDTTLLPPISDNLCVVAPNVAYDNALPVGQYQVPLYTPFDSGTTGWWDNLVQELLQAHVSVVNLENRGWANGNSQVPTTGGNLDPRRLFQFFNAATRAGYPNYFKAVCGIDPAGVSADYQSLGNTTLDLSVQSYWSQVWWQWFVEAWFNAVPKADWYRINGRPVIYIWSISNFTNVVGNEVPLLNYLEGQFKATYGEDPVFMLLGGWSADPAIASDSSVVANVGWFSDAAGYTINTLGNYNCGSMDPGYGENPVIIPRNGVTGTGVLGDTLRGGLSASFNNVADFMFVEGWNDQIECEGLYKSLDADWSFPNQYINILGSYTDLRSSTTKLEAEAADQFSPVGSAGSVYRSDGLNVRALTTSSAGWAVTGTTAGEWIQWDSVPCSAGNYKFPICYSSKASHTFQLQVDGTSLTSVTAPSTGGMNTFNTIYLGTDALAAGTHTFRLVFVDGGADVDWIFVKKYDSQFTFKSALNNNFITANSGGNSTLITRTSAAGAYEEFTVDDLTGAGAVSSGDTVYLQSYNGLYITAQSGGGSSVVNNVRTPGASEAFSLVNISGPGQLVAGNKVAIKTSSGNYLTVEKDGSIDAVGTDLGLAQTFTVGISQLSSPPNAAPTGLTATTASATQINLAWTDNSTNETGFMIERSKDGANFDWVATTAANSSTYSDSNLAGGTEYYYRVRATNLTANSDYSGYANATTLPGIPEVPVVTASMLPNLTNGAILLSWEAAPGATSYTVNRATISEGPYTQLQTVTSNSFSDTTELNGTTYYYIVKATNSSGSSAWSAQVGAAPVIFSQADIGSGTGSGSYSGGTFTLTGSGGDIWGTADQCHFAYVPMAVNETVVAKVTSVSSTYAFTKSGIMIRQSLAPGDANVLMSLLENGDVNFQYRTTSGGTSAFSSRTSGIVPPYWISLARQGNNFTSYFSPDGVNWTGEQAITVPMSGTIYVGLAQTENGTATFSNVSITGDCLAVPTNVSASLIPTAGNSSVQLSWNSVPSVYEYNILRSTTSGGPYTNIGVTSTNDYIDVTAVNGTSYYYVVSATDGTETTGTSAQVTVMDAAVPLGQAITLQAHANNDFVTAGSSPLIANATSIGTAQNFTVVDESSTYGPGYVALLAWANSEYVTAANSTTALSANSTTVGPTQVFYWNAYGNGAVSLSSYSDQEWVCADNTGTSPLIANRTTAGTWETYTILNDEIPASSYSSITSGIHTQTCSEGGLNLGYIANGSYAVYDNVNLNGAVSFVGRLASSDTVGQSAGSIVIHLDSPTGTVVGTCAVVGTGGWQSWTTQTCNLSGATGTHNVYLVFTGGSGYLFNMEWFGITF